MSSYVLRGAITKLFLEASGATTPPAARGQSTSTAKSAQVAPRKLPKNESALQHFLHWKTKLILIKKKSP